MDTKKPFCEGFAAHIDGKTEKNGEFATMCTRKWPWSEVLVLTYYVYKGSGTRECVVQGEISTWKGVEGRFRGYPREGCNAQVCTPVQVSGRVGSKMAVFAPTGAGKWTGRNGKTRKVWLWVQRVDR